MTFKKGDKTIPGNRFKPGESGNKNGRPKGSLSRNVIARECLQLMITIPDEVYLKLQTLYPNLEQILPAEKVATLAILHKAIMGDHIAYKVLLDSAYGAPKQEIDLDGQVSIVDNLIKVEIIKA